MFTTGGHYITLVSLDGNTIQVYDPYLYSGKFTTASRRAANVKVSGNSAFVSESSFKTYANYRNFWILVMIMEAEVIIQIIILQLIIQDM